MQIDVEAARRVVGGRVHRTPSFSSATLSRLTGAEIFLKAELFQRTGSFKPRGVLAKLSALTKEERSRGVVSASAGNHAQALAYGCGVEELDCLVCMWQGASEAKIAATLEYGAQVDLEAGGPAEVVDRLADVQERSGRTLVHGYDDPLLIAGHGTLGLELIEQIGGLDVVVVPAGGGGLVAGVGTAVRLHRPDARIVAVEPEGAAGLSVAIETGRPVHIEADTIAHGLNPPIAGEHCVAIARALDVETVTVSDRQIVDGLRFLYERAKLATELAGAAATGAVLAGAVPDIAGARVGIIVSGGNISPADAARVLTAQHPTQAS